MWLRLRLLDEGRCRFGCILSRSPRPGKDVQGVPHTSQKWLGPAWKSFQGALFGSPWLFTSATPIRNTATVPETSNMPQDDVGNFHEVHTHEGYRAETWDNPTFAATVFERTPKPGNKTLTALRGEHPWNLAVVP